MSNQTLIKMDSVSLKLIYDGNGPLKWSRKPGTFGMQDKAGHLDLGTSAPDGTVLFDLTLQVKPGKSGAPVLLGSFAHGPPDGRFLYLAWCEAQGALVQRLKLPLGGISWDDIRNASDQQKPLLGVLVDHHPRLTSTGENIGGSRPISWVLI
ncbi:DUF5990 family protein [Undibacterium terreum]|uniref:Uncharacterized protein n=1 Tax=Undibacterium terreum TaxID=1224302 RepID=A0A916ULB1_9BURK|nr:DUF5990 family protein [Undibacterium terreum]GGC77274.1 hypothetical protein GCM10011396_25530 [Undibacterium terreum]